MFRYNSSGRTSGARGRTRALLKIPEREGELMAWWENSQKQEVASICTTHFGLTEKEVQQCVNSFGSDCNERLKLQTFKVEDVEDLPEFLRKDQAPTMPSVTHSEGVDARS